MITVPIVYPGGKKEFKSVEDLTEKDLLFMILDTLDSVLYNTENIMQEMNKKGE